MQLHEPNITTLVKFSQVRFHLHGDSHYHQNGNNALMIYIKKYRKLKGFSLERLSELTGISAQHISRLERGERRWNRDNIRILAKALDCSEQDLIGDSQEGYQPDTILLSAIAAIIVVLERENVLRPNALRAAISEMHDAYVDEDNQAGVAVLSDLLECIDGATEESVPQRVLRLLPPPVPAHEEPPHEGS